MFTSVSLFILPPFHFTALNPLDVPAHTSQQHLRNLRWHILKRTMKRKMVSLLLRQATGCLLCTYILHNKQVLGLDWCQNSLQYIDHLGTQAKQRAEICKKIAEVMIATIPLYQRTTHGQHKVVFYLEKQLKLVIT